MFIKILNFQIFGGHIAVAVNQYKKRASLNCCNVVPGCCSGKQIRLPHLFMLSRIPLFGNYPTSTLGMLDNSYIHLTNSIDQQLVPI